MSAAAIDSDTSLSAHPSTSTFARVGTAGLALAVGGAFAGAAAEPAAVLVVLAALQLLGILAAVLFVDLPGRVGALVLGCAAVIGADAALWKWQTNELAPLLPVLGLAVPLLFAHQLTRGARRVRLVTSLSALASLGVALVAGCSWLQLSQEAGGGPLCRAAALGTGVAIAVTALVDLAGKGPRLEPGAPQTVLGLLAGALAGAVASVIALQSADIAEGPAIALSTAVGVVAVLACIAMTFALEGVPFAPAGRISVSAWAALNVFGAFAVVAPVAYILSVAVA